MVEFYETFRYNIQLEHQNIQLEHQNIQLEHQNIL